MRGFYYEQHSGIIGVVNGDFFAPLGAGFAGRQDGRNNPKAQSWKGIGPLPRGFYRLRRMAHPRFAAPAIFCEPEAENEMFGRSGFWIHGGTVSHGCPIFDRTLRTALSSLIEVGFDRLKVIE